jgi:hypothetical protein
MVRDSWRDRVGTLWASNAYASISFPALKLTPKELWIIGDVRYVGDEDGTRAELLLMPEGPSSPSPTFSSLFLGPDQMERRRQRGRCTVVKLKARPAARL